ncbi:MAG: hypothetical protein AAGF96_10080 [Bacteroidota bacterium]
MGQDLRKLFEEERKKEPFAMKQGHEERFLERLEEELPTTAKRQPVYFWWSIAATILLLVATSVVVFRSTPAFDTQPSTTVVDKGEISSPKKEKISLGDLSPDLQKVENYYVATINYEISRLQVSEENKGLVDGYLEQLDVLNQEYMTLNEELNTIGPNDETISALIQNLQLRLQLLQKLKEKLNQLKSSENEQETTII